MLDLAPNPAKTTSNTNFRNGSDSHHLPTPTIMKKGATNANSAFMAPTTA
jgi:hypothetical protein